MKKGRKLRKQKTMGKKNKDSATLRTCIVCREVAEQGDLIRFTWQDGKPLQDKEKKSSGRGAYCCKNEECYTAFLENTKRWKRAFRL